MVPNKIAKEAIQGGKIPELTGYTKIQTEARYGQNSRIDLLLHHPDLVDCYVEIKNVTAIDDTGVAFFPDAISKRGSKHLRELMAMVAQGYRAVIFFCVQRQDVSAVRPADEVDAEYGETLRQAIAQGVEAMAYKAIVSPSEIRLYQQVPVVV